MLFDRPTAEISEEEIKLFAAKYDPQPFHLDDKAARPTMLEGLAVSGWHTAPIATNLALQTRPFGLSSGCVDDLCGSYRSGRATCFASKARSSA